MSQKAFVIPTLDDDAIEALLYAATLAFKAGNFENASRIYRGITIARPAAAWAEVALGTALYGLDRAEEAEAAYRRALDLDASHQEANLYLGELIWNERRDGAGAQALLMKAFQIDPNSRIGHRARFFLAAIQQQEQTAQR